MMAKGILFDLDGVITDSTKFHYLAWKEIAEELGIEFDEVFNEKLKGISRSDSLELILKKENKKITNDKKEMLLEKKNKLYKNFIETMTEDDILPGMKKLIIELKNNNIKIAIASASQNAPYILEKTKILKYIDAIADPKKVKNSKPKPDIFIEASRLIDVEKTHCIAIEDSEAGISAINAANIFSIGIGKLKNANLLFSKTDELTFKIISEIDL